MFGITSETIYKQLRNNYIGNIVLIGTGALICLVLGIMFGTNLGWTHILTLVFLFLLLICAVFIVMNLTHVFNVKDHPVLIACGGADRLALRINNGIRNPVYLAYSLDGKESIVTLITDDFIVSGNEWTNIMELKNIRTIKPSFIPRRVVIMLGNPLVAIPGTLMVNKMTDAYYTSKGITSETKFDYLAITDIYGNEKSYGVQHKDMEKVLLFLLSINDQIRIIT
ncbi:MAG: hypothetical protein K5686_06985 [Lachnospiraceae bacterium]|nr:hypothetical protein [Lachnospiraceae bacterium]